MQLTRIKIINLKNMNKFIIVTSAVLLLVNFVMAENGLVNELEEDVDSGLDGGFSSNSIGKLFGRNDVLEDGIGNLNDKVTGECRSSKNREACRVCCGTTDKAFSYELAPGRLTSMSLHRCTCFSRNPSERVFNPLDSDESN